jgi:hypothetical protein
MTKVFLDKREREIDTRGHARRGAELSMLDEDRITFHLEALMAALENIEPLPVCGDPASIEQARAGEEKRTGE